MTDDILDNDLRLIRKVTWVGFWVNAALMVLKIAIGFYGHSDALVADGIHSLSDFATDFIVLAFVGIAYRRANSNYPYGHGKFETFASLLIAVILLGVAAGIAWGGIRTVIAATGGAVLPRPDIWTLIVAVISIGSKEWMFRYTYNAGKRVDSSSLMANAWHHRSDAISSIATLVGVGVSYFMAPEWRILDPLASVLIAVFIAISAVRIATPSVVELLERALPPEQVAEIGTVIRTTPGIRYFHHLRTRRNGHSSIVDVHIKVDPMITVTAGHEIATDLEMRLRHLLGPDIITSIHVEPYNGEKY